MACGALQLDAVKYVYLLRSLSVPDQRYVGVTSNLRARLEAHNAGTSPHTVLGVGQPGELAAVTLTPAAARVGPTNPVITRQGPAESPHLPRSGSSTKLQAKGALQYG